MNDVQVLTVAVNSGLVTFPTGFTKLGSARGLTLWKPVPVKDYVALGHVASDTEDEPSVKQVLFPFDPYPLSTPYLKPIYSYAFHHFIQAPEVQIDVR